jgi:phosphoglycerol transferase MdoB-like AlkP superfamily enzyme
MVEPFVLTPAALNRLSGIAGELDKENYYTAFFHGAANGSMGFDAFARSTGFRHYYGRTEYDADARFGGEADFDGNWAIWDEPFFQFYAATLGSFPQPFMSALFSASSHHPFNVPKTYEGRFPQGTLPIHAPIGYSDHALRRFFETAKRQPWYENTLFVITADHTNMQHRPESLTSAGVFRIPILFFAPDNSLAEHRTEGVAQQIDIMPTVLGYLGYTHPYIAFGCDLRATPPQQATAFNYLNGIYQYYKGDYLLQFDGERVVALYDFRADALLRQNLLGTLPDIETQMLAELKAFIQQYMERMASDALTIPPNSFSHASHK